MQLHTHFLKSTIVERAELIQKIKNNNDENIVSNSAIAQAVNTTLTGLQDYITVSQLPDKLRDKARNLNRCTLHGLKNIANIIDPEMQEFMFDKYINEFHSPSIKSERKETMPQFEKLNFEEQVDLVGTTLKNNAGKLSQRDLAKSLGINHNVFSQYKKIYHAPEFIKANLFVKKTHSIGMLINILCLPVPQRNQELEIYLKTDFGDLSKNQKKVETNKTSHLIFKDQLTPDHVCSDCKSKFKRSFWYNKDDEKFVCPTCFRNKRKLPSSIQKYVRFKIIDRPETIVKSITNVNKGCVSSVKLKEKKKESEFIPDSNRFLRFMSDSTELMEIMNSKMDSMKTEYGDCVQHIDDRINTTLSHMNTVLESVGTMVEQNKKILKALEKLAL